MRHHETAWHLTLNLIWRSYAGGTGGGAEGGSRPRCSGVERTRGEARRAIGVWVVAGGRGGATRGGRGRLRGWGVEEPRAEGELGGAVGVGEEAVVADAMEAVRQGVQQEAPDELVGRKGHDLGLAVVAVILPAE